MDYLLEVVLTLICEEPLFKLYMKKNKYLFELLFFILVMFGGICNAQCQGEDSLYFCPHGNYRILKIEKVGKSSKIKNRGKEYEFSNVGSLYIIYAKKMKDIFFNSEMDSDTIRILSIKNTRKKNGKKLKKTMCIFLILSLYIGRLRNWEICFLMLIMKVFFIKAIILID